MTVSLAPTGAIGTFTGTVERLKGDRILGRASYRALARMLPYTVERSLDSGATLYRAGNPARDLFLLLEGEVDLVSRSGHRLAPSEGWIGQEAATDVPHYFSDAVARGPARVLAISRAGLRALLAANPELKGEFYISLMESLGGGLLHEKVTHPTHSLKIATDGWSALLGWLLAIILPALILFFGPDWELPRNTVYFLAIFVTTLVMWVFSLTDEYIPGIFAVLTTLAMELVPTNVALAGLASEGFILAMSVLGLAAVMVNSGLGYRVLLLLLLKLPDRPFWHNTGLLITGFLLTPLVPSINGRVALITPLMRDMMEVLRCLPRGMSATALAVSTFSGASLLSAVFLSSKSVNFVIFGLLSPQVQDQFDWIQWTHAAAAVGVFVVISHLVVATIMFRANEHSSLSKERIAAQLALLGDLHRREWAAIFGILLFILAVLTTSVHKIQPAWAGLAVLYGLLVFGMLGKSEFRKEIDWPFLIYLGGIVSITSTLHYLNLDNVFAQNFLWLGDYMRVDFGLFLMLLAVVVFAIRLVVPISATIVIMATILMPIAENAGVNPWLVGFSTLVLGEMWFMPYQCSYYIQLRELTRGAEFYDEKSFLRLNTISNFLKLGALYASIPYWQMLGLL
ncbi:TRAP transporter large permease subunit [Gammaproteobacteria bacterium]